MKIKPKHGIDQLIFGMKQNDVEKIYGKPNKQLKDDDKNILYLYNELKLQLNFYEDEDFRLGYIITANSDLNLLGKKIIGRKIDDVKLDLPSFKTWEKENFDLAENYFNEENWIVLVSEFDEIVKVEMGCPIVDDEFAWKF
jgi:hypothetical protein